MPAKGFVECLRVCPVCAGCLYDGGSNKVPSCPAAPSPHCNEDHKCEAEGGHQLLTYIKVTSNGCDGCEEEGLSMKLVGDEDVLPTPGCETVGLDHPSKVDYAAVGEFHAVEEERPMGWGSCYQVGVQSEIPLHWCQVYISTQPVQLRLYV